MKDKLFKKRKHINWYSIRLELGDYKVESYHWLMMSHPSWRKLSDNRRSFLALQHVYGKKILKLFRVTGDYELFSSTSCSL